MPKEHFFDVCILGGGPSGLTAAMYTGRYGLKTVLITRNIGGTANLAEKIENYPGFMGSGRDLMKKFYEQARGFGAEFLNSDILDIEKAKKGFVIKLGNGKIIYSKVLIIALGTEKRKLGIPGEVEFLGRGVSYCASCDANFFKGKEVAVIGGSDSAAKTALLLSRVAKKVYLVYRGLSLRCQDIKKQKIKEADNIEIICNVVPLRILGDRQVKALEIKTNGKKQIKVDGVFVEIGAIPVIDMVKKLGIKTDKDGYIKVDEEMRTNVKGVFAAGDIIKSRLKQVVVAASQGAIAAKSCQGFLSKK